MARRRRPTRNYPFVSINRFFGEQSGAERGKKEPNEGRNGGLFLIAALSVNPIGGHGM